MIIWLHNIAENGFKKSKIVFVPFENVKRLTFERTASEFESIKGTLFWKNMFERHTIINFK